jgi:NADPH:quinone reductase-like Zn-dependent oxidoreductase
MTTSIETSKAYQVHIRDKSRDHLSPNALDNLVLATVPRPTPGPKSVLVRIRAAALNYRDLLVVASSPIYPVSTTDGLIPCADGAGEIVSVGPDSTWSESIGDSVILFPHRGWLDGDITELRVEDALGAGCTDGTLAQFVVVRDEYLLRMPKNLTFEEAASLPGAGGTAMNVLSTIRVSNNTTVLAQGTGGVSCFVIQVSGALALDRSVHISSSKSSYMIEN